MQKLKLAYNHPPELGRSILGTQKATGRQPRKTKTRPIESIGIEIKLSPTISLLLIQFSFRLRSLRRKNVMKAIKEAI